ncbi:MAG: DNA-binding protein [Desulfobaccales bacterium]
MQEIPLTNRWLWYSALIILALLPGLVGPAAAQMGGLGRGGGRGGNSGTHERQEYNLQTVTTVKGQVEDLGSYGATGWRSMAGMQVHGLLLKTDKGNITVHLGPPSYVRKQCFDLKQGDSLEVTGSQVTRDGQPQILAAQVKKDGQILKVRDEQGVPLWQEEDHGGRGSGGSGRGGTGSGGGSPGGRGMMNFNW